MRWVYIEKGIIKDCVRVDPFTVFLAEYAKQFIEAPDEVEAGWFYDGTTFTEPPAPPPAPTPEPAPAPTKEELLAQLQALQAQIQLLET